MIKDLGLIIYFLFKPIIKKETLNSDACKQFQQFPKDEQSLLTLTHCAQKRTTTYEIGNLDLGFKQTQQVQI